MTSGNGATKERGRGVQLLSTEHSRDSRPDYPVFATGYSDSVMLCEWQGLQQSGSPGLSPHRK